MKKIRCAFLGLVFLFTACNLAPQTSAPPTGSNATAAPPKASPTGPARPNQPVEFPPPVPGGAAEVIFANGTIITMDDAGPTVEAVAIQGNKILAVGEIADVFQHRGEATSVVDLEGRTLVPGFTDSHSHRIMKGIDGQYDTKSTIDESIAQGWTSLSEKYAGWDKMPKYLELAEQDDLRLRVNMYLPYNGALGEDTGDWWKVYRQDQEFSPRWRIAGMKIFTGINNDTQLLWTQDELNALLLARHREGWHLAIKTVSTESLEMILAALENIEKTDPNIVNRRVTLEHALFLTPEQIARVKRLGVIPSIQTNMPGELVGEQDIEELTAREPQGSAFPWRSLFSAGVIVAGGSSYPTYYVDEPSGAPFGSPLHLIYQAVTRVGNLGTQPEPWMLDQTITAEQALRALTINAAYANFQDDVLGSLTPGKLADMVILSGNPLTVSTPEINNIRVLMTMIDGQVEYCAPGFQSLCQSAAGQPGPIAPSPTPEQAAFSGTWIGPDPDDGSVVTVTLAQQGDGLTGAFADSFSGGIPPPGYEGSGSGNVLSPTTAQITFNLTRSDGRTVTITFTLTLSNQNNTLTLGCDVGCPIVLQRQ